MSIRWSPRYALPLLGGCIVLATPAGAQPKVVNVNLARASFLNPIPFLEPFSIQGKIPEDAEKIVVAFRPTRGSGPIEFAQWTRTASGYEAKDSFAVMVRSLEADRDYTFCAAVYGAGLPRATDRGALDGTAPASRAACDPALLADINGEHGVPKFAAQLRSTPRSSWKNHFDADLGVMGSSEAEYWGLVTSVHFQVLPYNKSVDLLDHGSGLLDQLGTRLSVFGGLSPVEISANTDQPVKKTSLGIPVVGVGFRGIFYWKNTGGFYSRFVQPLRLNAGVMFFEQDVPNPLLDKDRGKTDVFLSLTADVELKEVLGPLAGLFGFK